METITHEHFGGESVEVFAIELTEPKYICLACNQTWTKKKCNPSPYHGALACRDFACGATVVRVGKEVE